MQDGEDLYQHLTTMVSLADKLDEVTGTNITNKDFMMTMCFSLMGIPRYTNIIEIVMNGPPQGRGDLIHKLTATEQRHKVTNERPLELHTAMQALDNWVRKSRRKRGRVIIVRRTGTLQKNAVPNQKEHPKNEQIE